MELVGNVRFCCRITKCYLCPPQFSALIFHLQVFRPRVFLAPRPIFLLTVSALVFIRGDLGGEPHSSGSPLSLRAPSLRDSYSDMNASLFSARVDHHWVKLAFFIQPWTWNYRQLCSWLLQFVARSHRWAAPVSLCWYSEVSVLQLTCD